MKKPGIAAVLVIFSIFFFGCFRLSAQIPVQNVRGRIIDSETRRPLPGANVLLTGSNPPVGAQADEQGNFRIAGVPVGRQGFRCSFIGYEDYVITGLEVTSAREVVLNIELREKVYTSREVVISAVNEKDKAVNEMSVISTRQFTVEETNQFAGAWGDVSRMAGSFAGVTAVSDKRNDIIVRGNSPVGMLWRLEGVEIPNPNHFAEDGSSGGAISMINNNLLDNSDFASGAFAPEYGNATSAVFDLKMRNGNNEKREYIAQIGVNGLEIGAEGPFVKGRQPSYLASYRYSTVALLSLAGISLVESVPDFQDLSVKLNFPMKKGSLSFFGVGGISQAVYNPPKDSAKWKNPGDRFGYKTGSKTAFGGLVWFYPIRKNSWVRAILSSSVYNPAGYSDSTGPDYSTVKTSGQSSMQQLNIVSLLFNTRLSARHIFRYGLILRNMNFNDQAYYYTFRPGETRNLINNSKGSLNLLQGFFQYKFYLSGTLSLTPGFHALYLTNNGQFSLEPRLGLQWEITGNQSLSLGFGVHSQTQPAQIYFVQIFDSTKTLYPNKNLKFTRSYQAVIGYDYMFHENWRFRTEIYYQYLCNIPTSTTHAVVSMVNFSSGDDIYSNTVFESSGKGRNFGIELTLEKFLSRGFYMLFTSSIFRSQYFDGNRILRNTRFDANFAFNLLGGKEFVFGKKKNNIIGIGGKIVCLGGQKYTPVDASASALAGRAVYNDSLAYSLRLPVYLRIDLRVRYRLNSRRCSHEFAFELGNILNRKNVESIRWDRWQQQLKYNYDLPLVPIVQYRIEF